MKHILEIFIIIICIIIFLILSYVIYSKKQKKFRKEKRIPLALTIAISAAIVLVFTLSFVLIDYAIYKSKYNNFIVEVSDNIKTFEFNDLLEDIDKKMSDNESIRLLQNQKMTILIEKDGSIKEINFMVMLPVRGQYIEYYSNYVENGKIQFTMSPIANNVTNLNEWSDYSKIMADKIDSGLFSDITLDQELWIDINFTYCENKDFKNITTVDENGNLFNTSIEQYSGSYILIWLGIVEPNSLEDIFAKQYMSIYLFE